MQKNIQNLVSHPGNACLCSNQSFFCQMYAQAMTLIYQGERYRLDDKYKAVLHQIRQEFEQISLFEELYHCYVYSA